MQYDRAPVIRTGLPPLSSGLIRLVTVKNIKFRGSPSWMYLVIFENFFLYYLVLVRLC